MSRAFVPSEFRAGFLEMLPACIGMIPFGLVTGVGAAATGADWLAAMGLSTIIFSGAAQILATQLYAAHAPTLVIIVTCFVAGLRFLMYSAAMAPYLRPLPSRWQQGLAFLLTDQAFAASIRRFNAKDDPHGGASHFLGAGLALWVTWQITNAIGYGAGASIPASWSLEFAVPLCFLALVAPVLRNTPTVIAAACAGLAVVALDSLPMRLNLIAAGLVGILAGTFAELARERWTQR